MRLLFIRHGDPDYDHDCLTPLGQREAALTADRLASLPIDEVYVSPLGRAQETAQATLAKNGMTATITNHGSTSPEMRPRPHTPIGTPTRTAPAIEKNCRADSPKMSFDLYS